jgi:hypothetical protein
VPSPLVSMKIHKMTMTYIYIHLESDWTHAKKNKETNCLSDTEISDFWTTDWNQLSIQSQKDISSKGRSSSRLSASPFTCLWVAYHTTLGDVICEQNHQHLIVPSDINSFSEWFWHVIEIEWRRKNLLETYST